MAQTVNTNEPYGRQFFAWEFSEYERHERSRAWYIGAVILGILLIAYCIWTSNFLFALIILMVGFIVMVREYTEPHTIGFALYEDGIAVGTRYYPYKELSEFYIIYEPPYVKRLYIKPKGGLVTLSIPIYDQDPVALRELLLKYLKEDMESEYETVNDSLEKILKL